jgi:type I restriction enzyme S subunit
VTIATWRDCRLGDVLDVKHGFAFLGEHFSTAGTHVVLTPGNFHDQGGFKEKSDKPKWYNGPVSSDYILNEGDLIVAMTEQSEGLLGSSALIPRGGVYLHNQRLGLVQIRDPKKADKHFVYYLFNSAPVRQQIRASASGVKIRHTAPSRIAEVRVSMPPLAVQRRIASILRAYDAQIENCQRRMRILESMARALYQEWFVDLRFPGYGDLPRVASSLGDIPQGWEVKSVGEVAQPFRGRSYRSVDLASEGGLPFLNLKCIDRDGGFRRSGLKRYTGRYKESHVARKGDILVAVTDMTQERRIVARAALVPTLDAEMGICSMDLVRLEPKPPMPSVFLYSLLRYSSFADEVKQHANGANVLHLAPDRITDFRIVVPPADLITRFVDFTAPTFEQMDTLQNQVERLNRTRDLLLPRLLSGQLKMEMT